MRTLSINKPQRAPRRYRLLRLEPCEKRELLATVSGTVYHDLTGNGLTPDDPPWTVPPEAAPITLNLYADSNQNGIIDEPLLDSTTTDPATGQYEFDNLSDGDYILQQVNPLGMGTSAGPNPYVFEVVDNTVLSPGTQVIDHFTSPNPLEFYAITNPALNPFTLTTPTGGTDILFGSRDLEVEVQGLAAGLAANGAIGTFNQFGEFTFNSAGNPGTVGTLTYDTNINPTDLTGGGSNTGFRMDFRGLQVPFTGYMDYTITVSNTIQGTLGYTGRAFEQLDANLNSIPFSVFIPFTSFPGVTDGFFEDVDGVEIVLNSTELQNVDFILSGIVAGNPTGPDFAVTALSKRLFVWGVGWDTVPETQGSDPGSQPGATPQAPGGVIESRTRFVEGTSGDDVFEVVAGDSLSDASLLVNGNVVGNIGTEMNTLFLDGLGGTDYVILTGTDGTETLEIWPDSATMFADNWAINLESFESIQVEGGGGDDSATIYDTGADDDLVAWPEHATLTTPIGMHSVSGFASITVHSIYGGNDTATLYDSPGDDVFTTGPSYGFLTGDGYSLRTLAFEYVTASSPSGGYDSARMYDSPGNDILHGTQYETTLLGTGTNEFHSRVQFFDEVHAFASAGGDDTASLLGSVGNDIFQASPNEACLQGSDFYIRVSDFEAIEADASQGGFDQAILVDSAGDDVLVATPSSTVLSGAGYYNQVSGFDLVTVQATAGESNDVAYLYDSAGDDQVVAADHWLRLRYNTDDIFLDGFDWVNVIGSSGNDTKYVATIDFLLQFDGQWTNM